MNAFVLATIALVPSLIAATPRAAQPLATVPLEAPAPDPNSAILKDYLRDTVQSLYPGSGLPPFGINDFVLFTALADGLASVGGLTPSTGWCSVSMDAVMFCDGFGPVAEFTGGMGWPCDSHSVPAQVYASVQALAATELSPGRIARYAVFFPLSGGHGNVYPFRISLVGPYWTSEAYCIAAPNSVGSGAKIFTQGSIGLGTNDFTLLAGPVPSAATGAFFLGTSPTQTPFGNGFQCVGAPVLRLPPVKAIGNYLGSSLALPDPMAVLISTGGPWYFQAWYRDPAAGGLGFNLSDGVRITLCP